VWFGETPVPVVPSPKSQAYDEIEPSGSWEPEPSNDALRPASESVKLATGAWLVAGCTSCDTVAVPPSLSVTVKVIVSVPVPP